MFIREVAHNFLYTFQFLLLNKRKPRFSFLLLDNFSRRLIFDFCIFDNICDDEFLK